MGHSGTRHNTVALPGGIDDQPKPNNGRYRRLVGLLASIAIVEDIQQLQCWLDPNPGQKSVISIDIDCFIDRICLRRNSFNGPHIRSLLVTSCETGPAVTNFARMDRRAMDGKVTLLHMTGEIARKPFQHFSEQYSALGVVGSVRRAHSWRVEQFDSAACLTILLSYWKRVVRSFFL